MIMVVAALAIPRDVRAQSLIPTPTATSRLVAPPTSHLPPPGMCRIWLENVPAGKQPAPTDCASAIRNRPRNARVIFSDDNRDGKKAKGDDRKAELPSKESGKPAVQKYKPR